MIRGSNQVRHTCHREDDSILPANPASKVQSWGGVTGGQLRGYHRLRSSAARGAISFGLTDGSAPEVVGEMGGAVEARAQPDGFTTRDPLAR